MSIISEDRLWAGTETSLSSAILADKAIEAMMLQGRVPVEQESDAPRLLDIQGGIATVQIHGPLVNSDSPYLRMFGVTSYSEIRDALVTAAQNPEVKQVFLDVNSGGGAVSGAADTANLIRNINDNVKPVTTFTDGTMASAAYWLGSSAGKIYADKTAMVGSIGVIATHKEYSEAYKKEGVGVTVIRAGKDKALANSNEKLTERGKAQIQKMVDSTYEVFVQHVADMRNVSYPIADKQMADGQEFLSKDALQVGLIDGISTFDAVVSDLKQKSLDPSGKIMHNPTKGGLRLMGNVTGETGMARKTLSEQEIAAIAAGGGVAIEASSEALEQTQVEEPAAPVAEAQPVVEAVAAPIEQILTAQIREKDTALLEAGIKVARLEDKLSQVEAYLQPLKDIVGRSANVMNVALGGSVRDFASMPPNELVAEHARLAKDHIKFPVGGVAAVSSTADAETKKAVDPLHMARVNAVRFTK